MEKALSILFLITSAVIILKLKGEFYANIVNYN